MTRNGKIARLPSSLRDELNRRVRGGEPGKNLVDWLNSQPAVQEVLEKEFGGRAISEQNLSEWKQGGYEDWLRHQETRTWVQELASQSEDLSEDIKQEAGDLSVAELLSASLAIALGRCLHSTAEKAANDPKHARMLLDIARELARLRRDHHSQNCLRVERERWETELKLKLLTLISKGNKPVHFHKLFTQTLVEMRGDAIQKRYAEKKKRGSLSAKEEAHYQQALAKIDRLQKIPDEARANEHVLLAGAGSSDPEPFDNQSESNSIKPNQAA
jgi:hypothetical protein